MKHEHRLFTIGCSFTKYDWDTWADYVGSFYKEHINLGVPGAGNQFIATELTEAILNYDINPNDRIVIEWSSCEREDRYLSKVDFDLRKYHYWRIPGAITQQEFYDKEWVEKYTTKEHFVKRDFMLIHNMFNTLKYLKIPFVMTSMVDMFPPLLDQSLPQTEASPLQIINLSLKYGETLDEIKPSMKKIIFNNKWPKRNDKHPTTEEHVMYANVQLQEVINNEW
tara:strand:- start:383 stop:1054 length:672 start_codon:yes stop_codon:yes gene_type:complete